MKINRYALFIFVPLLSCSTLYKSTHSISNLNIDSTYKTTNYASEIQFHELSTGTINTKPDTAGLDGFIYEFDTTGYDQVVETDGLRLHTSVYPHIDGGKIIGYNIKSSAISNEQSLSLPVTRDIIIKGNFNKQEASTIMNKNDFSLTSAIKSPNVVWSGIFAFVLLLLAFIIFRSTRK